MRDDEFEARLIEWLDMSGEGDPHPYDADPYPADPRDARFDALCALYLEAEGAQRGQIPPSSPARRAHGPTLASPTGSLRASAPGE